MIIRKYSPPVLSHRTLQNSIEEKFVHFVWPSLTATLSPVFCVGEKGRRILMKIIAVKIPRLEMLLRVEQEQERITVMFEFPLSKWLPIIQERERRVLSETFFAGLSSIAGCKTKCQGFQTGNGLGDPISKYLNLKKRNQTEKIRFNFHFQIRHNYFVSASSASPKFALFQR